MVEKMENLFYLGLVSLTITTQVNPTKLQEDKVCNKLHDQLGIAMVKRPL